MSGNNISDDSEEASAITALTFPSRLILEPKSKKQTNNIKINSSLILFTTSMLKDKNKILSIQQNNKNDAKTYFMAAHFYLFPHFPTRRYKPIFVQPLFKKNTLLCEKTTNLATISEKSTKSLKATVQNPKNPALNIRQTLHF